MTETKKTAPRLPLEEQMRHVSAWRESGLTQVEYCTIESLSVKTFHNWVSKKKTMDSLSSRMDQMADFVNPKTKAVTADPLADANAQIRALEFQRDELMEKLQQSEGKLQDYEIKFQSLQNVIVILGHQVGHD